MAALVGVSYSARRLPSAITPFSRTGFCIGFIVAPHSSSAAVVASCNFLQLTTFAAHAVSASRTAFNSALAPRFRICSFRIQGRGLSYCFQLCFFRIHGRSLSYCFQLCSYTVILRSRLCSFRIHDRSFSYCFQICSCIALSPPRLSYPQPKVNP